MRLHNAVYKKLSKSLRFAQMRVSAAILLVILVVAGPSTLFADESNINVSTMQASSSRAINGPGRIRWFGINPLRYPNWTAALSGKVVAGPGAANVVTTSLTTANAIDAALPTPAPQPVTASPLPVFLPDFLSPSSSASADNFCDFSKTTTDDALKAQIDMCDAKLTDGFNKMNGKLDDNKRGLQSLITRYNTLVVTIDSILGAASNPSLRPNTGEDQTDAIMRLMSEDILKEVIGTPGGNPSGASQAIIRRFSAIEPWPADSATLLSDAANLQTVMSVRPDLVSPKSAIAKTIVKPTLPQKPIRSKIVSATAIPPKTSKPIAPLNDPADIVCASGSSQQYKLCQQVLSDIIAKLKTEQVGQGDEKAYTASYTSLSDFIVQRLKPLSLSRFMFTGEEMCRGLNSSRRDMTFTLTLDSATSISVDVVCQSKLLVSAGIGFSALPQLSYTNVPFNPYGSFKPSATTAIPNPLPSGAGVIQAVNISEVRPIPVTLLNYHVLGLGGERELFTSFGVGVGSSQSSTYIDYVGGLTVGLTRSALITAGAHLGAETYLQPGYSTSQFIVGAPPTMTRYKPAFVLIVSYGGGN